MVDPKKPTSLPLWNAGTMTVMSKKWPAESHGSLVIRASPRSRVWGGKASTKCLPAAAIEQGIGEVPRLTHNGAEGDALQSLGLLADNADEIAPDDLELDAVHVSYSFEAMMQPVASTFARQPGRMMMVVSRSSMIAGPLMLWPRASSRRS